MNRTEKAELIETLQATLSSSTSVVVAHQSGLTVAESSELRAKMREAGAGFKVTKNRLAKPNVHPNLQTTQCVQPSTAFATCKNETQ